MERNLFNTKKIDKVKKDMEQLTNVEMQAGKRKAGSLKNKRSSSAAEYWLPSFGKVFHKKLSKSITAFLKHAHNGRGRRQKIPNHFSIWHFFFIKAKGNWVTDIWLFVLSPKLLVVQKKDKHIKEAIFKSFSLSSEFFLCLNFLPTAATN